MSDIFPLDGIIGRFISASDEARHAFVDGVRANNERLRGAWTLCQEARENDRAEIERQQAAYGVLKEDYDAQRKDLEIWKRNGGDVLQRVERLNIQLNEQQAKVERLVQQLKAKEADNERLRGLLLKAANEIDEPGFPKQEGTA